MSTPVASDSTAAVTKTPDVEAAKDEHGASFAAAANQRIEGSPTILSGDRESAGLDLSPGLSRVTHDEIEHHEKLTNP